jgi:hypothetical protein
MILLVPWPIAAYSPNRSLPPLNPFPSVVKYGRHASPQQRSGQHPRERCTAPVHAPDTSRGSTRPPAPSQSSQILPADLSCKPDDHKMRNDVASLPRFITPRHWIGLRERKQGPGEETIRRLSPIEARGSPSFCLVKEMRPHIAFPPSRNALISDPTLVVPHPMQPPLEVLRRESTSSTEARGRARGHPRCAVSRHT